MDKLARDEIERAAEEAKEVIDPLELKSLEELDIAAEEDDEFADTRILESYRNKRLAEIKAAAEKNKFGRIYPLSRCDFVREVTDDSKQSWVVVFLFQDHITDSKILGNVLTRFAAKVKYVKFMSIRADACIENYPERNVPTLLLYHNGEMQSQIVTLAELGGKNVNEESELRCFYEMIHFVFAFLHVLVCSSVLQTIFFILFLFFSVLEWVFSKKGVMKTDLMDDPREKFAEKSIPRGYSRHFGSRRHGSDSDSDSD